MKRQLMGIAVAALAAAACSRTATVESAGSVAPESAPVTSRMIPVNTRISTRLDNTLGTDQSKVGDNFSATIDQPLSASNGQVVVPQGAMVWGHVTELHASQHTGDQASIRLAFDSLTMNGRSYPFNADVATTAMTTQNGANNNSTLKKAGIGAAAGAVLGAVLGGGLKGAVVGGALGAAAGTAISLGTGDVQAVLPAGTQMTLNTTQQVNLY